MKKPWNHLKTEGDIKETSLNAWSHETSTSREPELTDRIKEREVTEEIKKIAGEFGEMEKLTVHGLYCINSSRHVYHIKNGTVTHLNPLRVNFKTRIELEEAYVSELFPETPKALKLIKNFNEGKRYKNARKYLYIYYLIRVEEKDSWRKSEAIFKEERERMERLDVFIEKACSTV